MQDVIAIVIVALAAAFLARRGWRRLVRRPASGCGSCSACPATPDSQPLVSIAPISQAQPQGRQVFSNAGGGHFAP